MNMRISLILCSIMPALLAGCVYLDLDKKYLGVPKEVIEVLNRGEQSIQAGRQLKRDCDYTDFTEASDIKVLWDGEVNKGTVHPSVSTVFLYKQGESCFADAKLVQLSYATPETYGSAVAVYRCERDGIGEELKIGSHQASCGYMQYRTEWNIPVGKYTSVSLP